MTTTKAKTYIVGTRIRRWFQNPRTFEEVALRYNPVTGTISRPERAGCDVGPHVYIRRATLNECRATWAAAQDALFAEGFKISRRNGRPTTEMY